MLTHGYLKMSTERYLGILQEWAIISWNDISPAFPCDLQSTGGQPLPRTPYPQTARYRYRENDIYTHLLCPDHPAKLWISKPSWRTRQIEHLMISIPLTSRDPGGVQGSTECRETPQYPFRPWREIYHSRDS